MRRWPIWSPVLWGDYGAVLNNGWVETDREGRRALFRTGPWVPPISADGIGGEIVVTDPFRVRLEASGLSGFTPRRLHLARIVRVDWRRWDLTAPEPARYPPEGEPENYVLRRKHRPELAEAMEPMWELDLVPLAGSPDADFVRGDVGDPLVSTRARAWLLAEVPGLLRFDRG